MRRKDRERDAAFAWQIADKCTWAVLSLILPEGKPYGVPVSIARDGTSVYFHCAKEGQKTEALRSSAHVSISCVGDTNPMEDAFSVEYESAILFGRAVEVLDREEKIHGLHLLSRQHTPLNMEKFESAVEASLDQTAVWRVDVESITGKARAGKVIK